jgi:signal transduction histidine kinase
LVLRRTWRHRERHRLIGNGMMYYLIVAVGIITGLSKAHPSYVGGYCFLLCVLGAMPVQHSQLLTASAVSLSCFAALCFYFGVNFAEPALRYSLQDLTSTVVVSVVMSYGWTILRRNTFEKGRTLQEQNIQIQQQQDVLEEQNTALKQLNTEKDELIGIVSHDLRNPLSAILGMTEIMMMDEDLQPEVRQTMMLHMHDAATRMQAFVSQLLRADALENGALNPSLRPVDVHAIAEQSLRHLKTQADVKNILLVLNGGADNGNGSSNSNSNGSSSNGVANEPGRTREHLTYFPFALADEVFVRQILDNLISNAVKYSPHNTYIFVRMKDADSTVRLEVQDQGPGLTTSDMEQLFGKFARLSAQPTGGEQSTGLGLSIVKKMVDGMNGKVWCESEAGAGATFIVELPKA